jgi:polysaccharide biosynthesis protein PslH
VTVTGRTALLVPSNARLNIAGRRRSRIGGAEMRFESLGKALDTAYGCVLIESVCERSTVCIDSCAADPRWSRPPRDQWYYDGSYCERNAELIAERLISSGVSTVVCSSINVYRYVIALAAHPELHVIFDMHNVESVLYQDIRAALPPGSRLGDVFSADHVTRIARAERAAVEAADEIWVCGVDDLQLVRTTYGIPDDKNIRLVPDVVEVLTGPPRHGQPIRAVFTGRLDYYPNIEAAQVMLRDIAPLVDPLPVIVAGAQPDASLSEFLIPRNARMLADVPSMEAITRGGMMMVPLTLGGCGGKFKTIESFGTGLPVISTRKGVQGTAAEPGVHYLPADSPAEFAESATRLLGDRALRDAMVLASWELARDHHSLQALTALMAELDLAQ